MLIPKSFSWFRWQQLKASLHTMLAFLSTCLRPRVVPEYILAYPQTYSTLVNGALVTRPLEDAPAAVVRELFAAQVC